MKCKDLAVYIARKIVPQISDTEDRNILAEVIEVLNSAPIAPLEKKELADEYIASTLFTKDSLRDALKSNDIDPTDNNLNRYFPLEIDDFYHERDAFSNAVREKAYEAGGNVIQRYLTAAICREEEEFRLYCDCQEAEEEENEM